MSSSPPSIVERISELPKPERDQLILSLSPERATTLKYDWPSWARPNQLPPPGSWSYWMVKAGRGFGKTRTGAEFIRQKVKDGAKQLNIIVRTVGDIEKILVRSPGGVLKVCADDERPRWIANKRLFEWPGGATTFVFTAEEPDSLRGPECEFLWADELASWRYGQETWDNAMMGLRLGQNPQAIITTTPRPTKLVRELIANPFTALTAGTTYENRANLAPAFYTQIIQKYEGTRLGRQELLAEVLDDNPGALFKLSDIEGARVQKLPPLVRIVVAMDPATTSNEESDEWGIIAAGQDGSGSGALLRAGRRKRRLYPRRGGKAGCAALPPAGRRPAGGRGQQRRRHDRGADPPPGRECELQEGDGQPRQGGARGAYLGAVRAG